MPERYRLEYLPLARQDMVDIVRYISRELQNPAVARRTANALIETAARIAAFPYANPVHVPLRPLQQEYRKALSGNYYMFYHVDEARALVTVDRVLYARRSEDALLK